MRNYCVSCLTALTALMTLTACDADEKYSDDFLCSFTFYADQHPTSLLTRTLGNQGTFVIVSVERREVNHIVTTSANGEKDDIALTTEKENKRLRYDNMGANGSLIIGASAFDGLTAYDRQCPNCVHQYGGVNYPLAWTDNTTIVSCARCKRNYNLNYQGSVANGQKNDRPLMQYRVAYNGAVLNVHN